MLLRCCGGVRFGTCCFLPQVDVEGHELEVLRGVTDALDWARIEQVAVETHSEHLRCVVIALLSAHYKEVRSLQDSELSECGLHNAMVYARLPLRGGEWRALL